MGIRLIKIIEDYCKVNHLQRKDDIIVTIFDKENKLIGVKTFGELTYEETFLVDCSNKFSYTKPNEGTIRVNFEITKKEHKNLMKVLKWKLKKEEKEQRRKNLTIRRDINERINLIAIDKGA